MAGGIDWFRWHHGSVTDPKFQLVARKAGARFGDVVTVWAYVLEAASASDERGQVGAIDAEAVDCMLGADDGTTARILDAMQARGLIDGGAVVAWEKRQPKRERPDDNSTERSRAFREKQRQAEPCNATQRHETPRGEERREEEQIPSLLPQAPAFPAENRPADQPQLSLVEAPKAKARTVPDCPHLAVLALWAEALPAMPQHNPGMWRGARADHLRARWRETAASEGWETEADGLAYFRRLFGYVGRSAFLTGRAKSSDGRPPFVAELAWIVCPENWAKVHEGKYHTEAA